MLSRRLSALLTVAVAGLVPLTAAAQDTKGPLVETGLAHQVDRSAADTVSPSVARIWISSPPQGGDTWLAGEEMRIQVRFDEPVEVTGNPRLALEIGDRTAFATYDWVNDRTIQFRYTVQATDRDTDGISIGSGALRLNGGTVTDVSGNAANLSLGRSAVTDDPDHKVDGSAADTVPPSVTRIWMSSPPQGGDTWLSGEEMQIYVYFNEPVGVAGSPRLALTVGDRTVLAVYDWHGGNRVRFRYAVQATDRDADGISIGPAALRLNGGTITDGSGNAANLSLGRHAITNDPAHKVDGAAADTVPPSVVWIWISSPPQGGDTWLAGEEMRIQVHFNEPVEVTGAPRLALTVGNRTAFANYDWLGGNRVQFRYAVQAADHDADGISIGSAALRLNGGTITDGSGNAANLSLGDYAVTNHPGHKVDGAATDMVPPVVTRVGISSPPQGSDTWLAGEEMQVYVYFNEPVEVTGAPRLALTVGNRTALAVYNWHGGNQVRFRYAVQATDRDADGISIGPGALRLNGGTITDGSGNAANLSLGRHAIMNDPAHKVDGAATDTVPPAVTRIWISSPPQGGDTWLSGEEMQILVYFNEPVEVTGAPRLALTVGDRTALAVYNWHGGNQVRFGYAVQATDRDADGISIGPAALRLNGGAITDRSGNAAKVSLGRHAITNDPAHKVDGAATDTVPPVVTQVWISSPPQGEGTWLSGEEMRIRIRFNEPVEVTGTPRLALTVGDRIALATFDRHSGIWVYFRYTVEATDRDADGISIGPGALRLNGGTITDGSGNAANLSLGRHAIMNDPAHKVDGAATDTVPPVVTRVGISSPPQGGDTWLSGEEMQVYVYFNEPVEVTGAPRLALTVGDRTVLAVYNWHGGNQVRFRYAVQATDRDADGISIGSEALQLNGGTITDRSGNAAKVSLGRHAITNDPAHKVDGAATDTVPPAVTQVWISSPPQGEGTWLAGEEIEIRIQFNEPVEVTGTPGLALTVGDRIALATYDRQSGIWVYFRYTVEATDRDADGISIGPGALRLNGGTITDGSGNAANLSLEGYAVTNDPERKVDGAATDTVPPFVTRLQLSQPADEGDTWHVFQHLEVFMTFNEDVVVSGEPRLALRIGGVTAEAVYVPPSFVTGVRPVSTVRFRHVVRRTDVDEDGISIDAHALILNGATIRDNAGNDANLDLSAHAFENHPDHKVDAGTVGPRVAWMGIAAPPPQGGDTWFAGEKIEVLLRFTEEVAVSGTPRLVLTIGDQPADAAYTGVWKTRRGVTFEYLVQPGDRDDDGLSIAANALHLDAGSIRDNLGNRATLDLSEQAIQDDPKHKVDGDGARSSARATVSSVAIVSAPQSGSAYQDGETIRFQVRFSRDVTVSGRPDLRFRLGDKTRMAQFVSQEAGTELVFAYTVAAEDWDEDGISTGADALQWPEGLVRGDSGLSVLAEHEGIPDQPGHQVRAVSGPEIVRPLPTLRLVVGAAPAVVELSGAFGGARNYDADSSRAGVAAASVSGSTLQIAPLSEGQTRITVSGSNRAGSVTQGFRVEVIADPAEVEAVEEAMEALSRGLLTGATDVIRTRMESGASSAAGGTSASAPWNRTGAGEMNGDGVRALFLADQPWSPHPDGNEVSMLSPLPDRVELSLAQEGGDPAAPGIRWTLWGAADQQSSTRNPEGASGYESRLRSPYVGVDAAGESWLAGVAAARNVGTADYRYDARTSGTGSLDLRLTSVHPYLRITLGDQLEVWGIMGVGGGDFDVDRSAAGERESGSLRMWMGTIGARRSLAATRGFRLSLRGDAGVARLSTADVRTGVARGLVGSARRIRLGAESSLRHDLSETVTITPSVEVSGRFDGGEHLQGTGLEAAGGVQLTAGSRFRIEVRGRMLLAHSEQAYEEKGGSVAVRLLPDSDGRGFSLALTPRWGAGDPDIGALWRTGTMSPGMSGAHSGGADSGSTNGQAGYGFAVGRLPGTFQFFSGIDRSARGHQRIGTGARYELRDAAGKSLDIELIGDRILFGERAANRVGVRLAVRY